MVFLCPPGIQFIGLDNFFYTARSLGLKQRVLQLTQLEAAAKHFCTKKWAAVRSEYLTKHSRSSEAQTLKVGWCHSCKLYNVSAAVRSSSGGASTFELPV